MRWIFSNIYEASLILIIIKISQLDVVSKVEQETMISTYKICSMSLVHQLECKFYWSLEFIINLYKIKNKYIFRLKSDEFTLKKTTEKQRYNFQKSYCRPNSFSITWRYKKK